MPRTLILVVLTCLSMGAAGAHAQGIDCSRARSATEKAICASPALMSLDREIAAAYADALARQPQQRAAMRQDLLAWLRRRDTACHVPAARLTACLTQQMTARLAELAPPAAPAMAAGPMPQATPNAPAAAATLAPPQAAAAPPPEPAVPTAANPPPPAATLDQASLPAADESDTLLHVTSPGRFAIAAHSASGAALQLVDMLAGPSETAGAPGSQDGRLDELLDAGTYKIRVFSAKGATGAVALAVTPFRDAVTPRALPAPGFPLDTTLRDGEQRAFWLTVPPSGEVRIEAAGRSLADLRLWRDGRELTALDPAPNNIEPTPGHPLTDLRLVGKVEPGTYLAVAYGGPALPWTDNSTDQPFHLRAGAADALTQGWAGGTVGPFGSEVFALPPATRLLRLDLPATAPATLAAGDDTAAIARNSREPVTTLAVDGKAPVVELTAAAGQHYTLRAFEQPDTDTLSRPGTYWVSAVTTGTGGDEVPPGVLLERSEGDDRPPRIVADALPALSPAAGWHARFNLRGPTALLFHNTAGGAVAVHSSGVPVRTLPGQADLPADYYRLTVAPTTGALGGLDLAVGPPGRTPPVTPPLPVNPVIPLGVQTIESGQSLTLHGVSGPGITIGLSARPVPVALAEGPLSVTLATGASLSVPVAIAPGGTLGVTEVGAGAVPYGLENNATPGRATVVLPVADHARTLVLSWHRTALSAAAIPAPPPPGQTASLQAGKPDYLDLARGEQRGFALTVPTGGLYRIETLGRLHTAGRLATPFIPALGQADGNGVGQNMLIQTMLRAGRYRVDVTAEDSAGHLGMTAAPAPLLAGTTLLPGGSVRATLPAGTGVSFPIAIAGPAERYHLEVAGLGAAWTGRVEDSEGWPITKPGPVQDIVQALRPGQYRLLIAPDAVARQVVARLSPVVPPVAITGHGPHPLPFEAPQHATWREPEASNQPRTPDAWTFTLAGPAKVTLSVGDGMAGELHRDGVNSPVAHIVGHDTRELTAGAYRLDATSLGRNDRLDYTVTARSEALQPDTPRQVSLPASVPFAIAEPRVVSLTTFGTIPVKAVLRRADGSVVARYGARADDWNVAVSRLLPAGSYTLDLDTAAPPGLNPTAPPPSDDSNNADTPDNGDNSDASDNSGDQAAQTNATRTATPPAAAADHASDDSTPDDSSQSSGDQPAPTVELRLALPPSLPPAPAPTTPATLTGTGVHVLTLPQPAPGSLVLAQAQSPASLVLALERQAAQGWQIVALDQGTAPIVASPADDSTQPWRLEAWTVDGGPEPITLAARAASLAAQAPGQVSLAALDGLPLAAAHVRLPAPGIATLDHAPAGLLAGGWPGHGLAAAADGTVLPEGAEFWLLSHAPATLGVAPLAMQAGQPAALTVPAGLVTTLPAVTGHLALWRAESGLGQPGLGAAMGVANGSALALADQPVTLRNAAGDDALRLTLTRLDPAVAPSRTLDGPLQTVLPPGSALPLVLPSGGKQVQFDLAPGVAAIAGHTVVAWTGDAAVSRTVTGGWTELMLVNTGTTPAPASLAFAPAPAATLQPGTVLKRFFGAAGSFELPVSGGTRLAAAGKAHLTFIGADGTVAHGRSLPLSGPGRAVVTHQAGAVAVWVEGPGASPWPDAAAQTVQPPTRLAMSGPAMTLHLTADTPELLHVSTTAPVLLGLTQPGRADPPELFADGAELHRMVAGAVDLHVYSATDGPLSGTLDIAAAPVTPVQEGLGAETSVAPGGSAVFGFALAKAATVGVGVRAAPDTATVRLLDATGAVLGTGVAQLHALKPGQYMIEASVPPDSPPATLRPAVVGISPRNAGPPPEVVRHYLELVGMKPTETRP